MVNGSSIGGNEGIVEWIRGSEAITWARRHTGGYSGIRSGH